MSSLSKRVLSLSSKASDLHALQLGEIEHDGYLPDDLGIGGGDYVELELCLHCGQVQGEWPLPLSSLETGESEDDNEDENHSDDTQSAFGAKGDTWKCKNKACGKANEHEDDSCWKCGTHK